MDRKPHIIRRGNKAFCGGVALQNFDFIFTDYSKSCGGGVYHNVCNAYGIPVIAAFELNFIFPIGGVSFVVPGKNRYKVSIFRTEVENIFKS